MQYVFLSHSSLSLSVSLAVYTFLCLVQLTYLIIKKFLVQVNLCQKLFFLQNMGRTCCVQKLFWMSGTLSVHNMFYPCSELGIFMYWTCNSMNNLSLYCGLVDAKIRASDKDLPVQIQVTNFIWVKQQPMVWRIFQMLPIIMIEYRI